MATYQDLIAQRAALEKQKAELDKQISAARLAERSQVIAQIKALMADHGVTLSDLGGRTTRGVAADAQPRGGKRSALAGKKVPPKYRNHATGETWSGRGLQPRWLREALAAGRKLESFVI